MLLLTVMTSHPQRQTKQRWNCFQKWLTSFDSMVTKFITFSRKNHPLHLHFRWCNSITGWTISKISSSKYYIMFYYRKWQCLPFFLPPSLSHLLYHLPFSVVGMYTNHCQGDSNLTVSKLYSRRPLLHLQNIYVINHVLIPRLAGYVTVLPSNLRCRGTGGYGGWGTSLYYRETSVELFNAVSEFARKRKRTSCFGFLWRIWLSRTAYSIMSGSAGGEYIPILPESATGKRSHGSDVHTFQQWRIIDDR